MFWAIPWWGVNSEPPGTMKNLALTKRQTFLQVLPEFGSPPVCHSVRGAKLNKLGNKKKPLKG